MFGNPTPGMRGPTPADDAASTLAGWVMPRRGMGSIPALLALALAGVFLLVGVWRLLTLWGGPILAPLILAIILAGLAAGLWLVHEHRMRRERARAAALPSRDVLLFLLQLWLAPKAARKAWLLGSALSWLATNLFGATEPRRR